MKRRIQRVSCTCLRVARWAKVTASLAASTNKSAVGCPFERLLTGLHDMRKTGTRTRNLNSELTAQNKGTTACLQAIPMGNSSGKYPRDAGTTSHRVVPCFVGVCRPSKRFWWDCLPFAQVLLTLGPSLTRMWTTRWPMLGFRRSPCI